MCLTSVLAEVIAALRLALFRKAPLTSGKAARMNRFNKDKVAERGMSGTFGISERRTWRNATESFGLVKIKQRERERESRARQDGEF